MTGHDEAAGQKTVGRAAFLGGLLAFSALVACSVIGIGHARALEGRANIQYWVVVGLVAATLLTVTIGLARTPAVTRPGEALRRLVVPVAFVLIGIFLWETIALGVDATSPFQLIGRLLGR